MVTALVLVFALFLAFFLVLVFALVPVLVFFLVLILALESDFKPISSSQVLYTIHFLEIVMKVLMEKAVISTKLHQYDTKLYWFLTQGNINT